MNKVSDILDRENSILGNIKSIQQDLAIISAQSITMGVKNMAMRSLLMRVYSCIYRLEEGGELMVFGGSGTLGQWQKEIKDLFNIDEYGNPHE